jgi:phage shock protein E
MLAALLAAAPACSPQGSPGARPSETPTGSVQAEAWKAIRDGALLVDVRTRPEFDRGHLEGALLVPHDEIVSRAAELGDDRDRTIVLYCRTGNRSARAKRALEDLGYTHVINAGGYENMIRAR